MNSIYSLKHCIQTKNAISHLTCANVDPFSVGWFYMNRILSKCWPKSNGKRKPIVELTITEIKDMKYAIIAVSFTQFKKINKDKVCNNDLLEYFNPIFKKLGKLAQPYEEYIARKCYTSLEKYNESTLDRIGNAAFDVNPKTFLSTTKEVLVKKIDKLIIASSYGNRGSIKAFTSRFTSPSDADTVVKFLSHKKISKNINVKDFDNIFGNDQSAFNKLKTIKQTIKSFHLVNYLLNYFFEY